ncbi:MAG TPA: MFS transporter [Steroidobacteraceae bacterium]|nr:MFS transporter [Steroidobacteraceae bacterium]
MGCGLAHVGTSTMPFQVGALVEGGHRRAGEAGLFGLFQVGALALSMIFISRWVDRLPPRTVALSGCSLVVLANVGLFVAHAFPLQMLFAIAAGLGYGFVFAATVASAAARAEPDRIYAIANGGALLIVVGVMTTLPSAQARFGTLGVFVALAALPVVCAPFMLGFDAGCRPQNIHLTAWRIPGAAGLLFAWAAFSAGTGALYAFSERIGSSIHLRPTQIAVVLSSGVFVGVIGTGLAALMGSKVNRPRALVLGLLGSGLACLLLGFATSLTLFAAGVCVYWVFYMFLYSYLLGTAAVLDPTGRVGTLGGGLERLGYACGAGAGGFLSEHASYSSTGLLGFGGCVLGLVVGLPTLLRALQAKRNHFSAARKS